MKTLSKQTFSLAVGIPFMPISIADVAKKANVSISTVSRVLNRRDLVNEKTRLRVESAISELGYRPNAFARGLMLGRSDIVGLVLPDLHGEFYSEIIRGANAKARQLGYNLVVSSFRDGDDTQSLLAAIQQRSLIDGVAIMFSEFSVRESSALPLLPTPFVVLDDDVDGVPHDSVVIDQAHGARAMMRHLLDRCSVTRVIFVGGHENNVDTQARLAVCRTELRAAGRELLGRDVFHLDYQYETAFTLAANYVRAWAGRGNCVFAANDEMAAGIVAATVAAGLHVPTDLAVVGFDDTRVARMTRPALTTVRVPMSDMGARAIEMLCARISDPERQPTRVSLTPELIVRESCGARGV